MMNEARFEMFKTDLDTLYGKSNSWVYISHNHNDDKSKYFGIRGKVTQRQIFEKAKGLRRMLQRYSYGPLTKHQALSLDGVLFALENSLKDVDFWEVSPKDIDIQFKKAYGEIFGLKFPVV